MSNPEPIIDINPIASKRGSAATNAAERTASTGNDAFQTPSFGRKSAPTTNCATGRTKEAANNVAAATVIEANSSNTSKKPNIVGGVVQTVVGGAIMLVGIPMLILPGPGLLAIGGGAVLAGGGIKKMLGR